MKSTFCTFSYMGIAKHCLLTKQLLQFFSLNQQHFTCAPSLGYRVTKTFKSLAFADLKCSPLVVFFVCMSVYFCYNKSTKRIICIIHVHRLKPECLGPSHK